MTTTEWNRCEHCGRIGDCHLDKNAAIEQGCIHYISVRDYENQCEAQWEQEMILEDTKAMFAEMRGDY